MGCGEEDPQMAQPGKPTWAASLGMAPAGPQLLPPCLPCKGDLPRVTCTQACSHLFKNKPKNQLLASWLCRTQERAAAAQAAASATPSEARLQLLSCSEKAEEEKSCMEGANKKQKASG